MQDAGTTPTVNLPSSVNAEPSSALLLWRHPLNFDVRKPLPPLPEFDVADCVLSARRGSQGAYTALFRRFAPLVHAILLGRGARHGVDDLLQDCFAAAFNRLDQLEDPSRFGAWISTIARRASKADGPDPMSDEASALLVDATSGPAERAEVGGILRAVHALPPAYRETLLLRLVEGLSGPEIAQLTGLTPQSVRVNLHRGMRKLRDALGLPQLTGDDHDI